MVKHTVETELKMGRKACWKTARPAEAHLPEEETQWLKSVKSVELCIRLIQLFNNNHDPALGEAGGLTLQGKSLS